MNNRLKYIPNVDKQNYTSCRFQLLVKKIEIYNLKFNIRTPKFLSKRVRKYGIKTLGTHCIFQSNVPSLPDSH